MSLNLRLAKLEKYYCTKILESLCLESSSYFPENDEGYALDQIYLEVAKKTAVTNPEALNLITHEERLKYDPKYARHEKVKRLGEANAAGKILSKKTEKDHVSKIISTENGPSSSDLCYSPHGDTYGKPQSKKKNGGLKFITDEEIMKWDPENFDRIHQIVEENERLENGTYLIEKPSDFEGDYSKDR